MSEERLKEIKKNIDLDFDVPCTNESIAIEELYNEVIRLREENNILKELNVCVGCENNYHKREIAGIQVVVSGETYNEYKGTLQDQISELENRIEKAVEYIKWQWQEIINNENYKNHLWTVDGLVIKKILNILNGRSDE